MRRFSAVAVFVIGAAMVGVACGGGGSSTGGTPIKLGYSAWPGWFPWQIAEFVVLIVIGLLGLTSDLLLRTARNRLAPWSQE